MKQTSPSRKWLRIEEPEAARIVTDPAARRFLLPFIGQERPVSKVATELEVDTSSMLYRVRQFVRLGLIEEVRVEPRQGRPIRYYCGVADGFFVPFQATSLTTQMSLSPHAFSQLQARLNESIGQAWLAACGEHHLGMLVFRNAEGNITHNIVPDPEDDRPNRFFDQLLEPDAPAVWDTWGNLRLTQADAKALQIEIATILKQYRPKEKEGEQEYLLRLAMAPTKQ